MALPIGTRGLGPYRRERGFILNALEVFPDSTATYSQCLAQLLPRMKPPILEQP